VQHFGHGHAVRDTLNGNPPAILPYIDHTVRAEEEVRAVLIPPLAHFPVVITHAEITLALSGWTNGW